MNEKADERQFVTVFPDGTGDVEFGSFYWNAVHCCSTGCEDKVDDSGFMQSLVEYLIDKLNLDIKIIFLTGFSNGGHIVSRNHREDMFEAETTLF